MPEENKPADAISAAVDALNQAIGAAVLNHGLTVDISILEQNFITSPDPMPVVVAVVFKRL